MKRRFQDDIQSYVSKCGCPTTRTITQIGAQGSRSSTFGSGANTTDIAIMGLQAADTRSLRLLYAKIPHRLFVKGCSNQHVTNQPP